jgi:4-amino-4-deoxy-L-arabinose transferase-like glycosyltransferase
MLKSLTTVAIVLALLAAHWLIGVRSWQNKCQTYDETPHLTAGYAYWKFGDFRLQPENGNLPQRWVSLPLVSMPDLRFPSHEQEIWRRSDVWKVGDQFCHQLGNDFTTMLRRARSMAALLGVAVCLAVFLWSRRLFGVAGGFVSLLLCALCPTMLAHAPLATSDMCAALFFTLSVAGIWSVLDRVSLPRVLASSVAVSGLFLSKFSAVLILPMAALMIALHWLRRREFVVAWGSKTYAVSSRSRQAIVLGGVAASHALIATLMIWWAYGWRHSPAPPEAVPPQYLKFETMEGVAPFAGTSGGLLYWMSQQRLLPEAFLYGQAFTLAHRSRGSFFLGEHTLKGSPLYFPYCVMVKTPLALFGLLLMSAAWIARQVRRPKDESGEDGPGRALLAALVPLMVLLAVYWGAAIVSSINIGHRHMLPTYPAMFILAGGAAGWLSRRTWLAAGVVAALVVAFVVQSARGYPHYLAYFNPLLPRETAYRQLADSNLDWGQDLPGLKRFLNRDHDVANHGERVYLAYFGTGSPEYYGIEAERLPVTVDLPQTPELRAGIYCISATALANVYGEAPGRWNRYFEDLYRDALLAMSQQAASGQKPPIEEQRTMDRLLLWLRLARLYAYLRQRAPDAHVGYSILIFRLGEEQLQAALEGPPAELDSQSWGQREDTRQP